MSGPLPASIAAEEMVLTADQRALLAQMPRSHGLFGKNAMENELHREAEFRAARLKVLLLSTRCRGVDGERGRSGDRHYLSIPVCNTILPSFPIARLTIACRIASWLPTTAACRRSATPVLAVVDLMLYGYRRIYVLHCETFRERFGGRSVF